MFPERNDRRICPNGPARLVRFLFSTIFASHRSRRKSVHRKIGSSYSGNEIFEGLVIFYSWRALNAATNVNCVWRPSCDGFADILFGQPAGENKESCKRTRYSCGQPITRQTSSATEVGMVRVKQHVAIANQRRLFGSKLSIRRERSDHTKLAS